MRAADEKLIINKLGPNNNIMLGMGSCIPLYQLSPAAGCYNFITLHLCVGDAVLHID